MPKFAKLFNLTILGLDSPLITILGKLRSSCCQLEPNLLKIHHFLLSKISKLLCTLNVQTPCSIFVLILRSFRNMIFEPLNPGNQDSRNALKLVSFD